MTPDAAKRAITLLASRRPGQRTGPAIRAFVVGVRLALDHPDEARELALAMETMLGTSPKNIEEGLTPEGFEVFARNRADRILAATRG